MHSGHRLTVALVAGLLFFAGALPAIASAAGQPAGTARATSAKPLAAHLLQRAQLRTSPGGSVVTTLATTTEFGTPRVLAVVARTGRWLGVLSESMPNGRVGWISADATELRVQRYGLELDRSERLLTVRRDNRVIHRMRVAVGKASTVTPVGLFATTDALSVDGGSSAYGCCAMPLTGHQASSAASTNLRLGIHGTGAEGSVGSAASAGCLRGRTADMRWLMRWIQPGTPLRIRA